MKAYKLLNNYNGRYFSYNLFPKYIRWHIRKQKIDGIDSWKIIEYFPGKWAKAKRNAKEKHLFVFDTKSNAIPKYGFSEGVELWEVEVPKLMTVPSDWYNSDFYGFIIPNSFLCTTLKMVRKIM